MDSERENPALWRLALSTVARTVLYFTLPYIVSYYCVIGIWRVIQMLSVGRLG
jgi:hypothetical protein